MGRVLGERRRPLLVVCAGLALTAFAAGCGDDTSGSDSGGDSSADVSEAKKALAADEAPVKWEHPGPKIEVGDKLRGKTIYYISNGLNFPFSQSVVAGVKEAAEALGMKTVVTDGAGDSAKAARLVDQAIGRKAAAIVIQGFPADQLSAPIGAAKEAGIPVVMTAGQDAGPVPTDQKKIGVSAFATFCYSCVGREVARFVTADSGGDANVVVFDVPDIGSSASERGAFEEEIERLCPDCKVTVKEAPLAQWVKGLPNLTSSTIKADPTVDYLFPLYDGMVANMKPAVHAANATDRVKIVSYNANKPNLEAIQKEDVEVADVGGGLGWNGWGVVDQVARLLTDNPPVDDERVPNRTFTKKVVDSIDLSADESTWYGDVDFRDRYQRLWGVR